MSLLNRHVHVLAQRFILSGGHLPLNELRYLCGVRSESLKKHDLLDSVEDSVGEPSSFNVLSVSEVQEQAITSEKWKPESKCHSSWYL